jgi:hypothetical protein
MYEGKNFIRNMHMILKEGELLYGGGQGNDLERGKVEKAMKSLCYESICGDCVGRKGIFRGQKTVGV